MENDIKKLAELQKLDKTIDALITKKDITIPENIKNIQNSLTQDKDTIEIQKKEIDQTKVEMKNSDIELKTIEASISKHLLEQNSVKSNETYKALLKEIETDKHKKDEIETKILEQMDKIDQASKILKDKTDKYETIHKSKLDEIKNLENEITQISSQLDEHKRKREELSKNIKQDFLTKYERLRGKKNGIAISLVVDNYCSECNIKLLMQTLEEVKRCDSLTICDNCGRILYNPEPLPGK